MSRVLFLVLLALFCFPQALGVGFSNLPAQREIIFSPGSTVEIPLMVVKGSNIQISISSQSPGNPETLGTPLDDNILAYATLVDERPNSGERPIALRFAFPQTMRPGIYTVDLYATDYPPDQQAATITAIATTKLRFTIRVLAAEKLLEATSINAPPIAQGLDANVNVGVVSRTTSVLDKVQATVMMWQDSVLVASATTPEISLASAQSAVLSVALPTADVEGGEYIINATVAYDGLQAVTPLSVLKIGTLHVDIAQHTTDLWFNTTNKFVFNISNEWNRELQDVHAVVLLGGQSKKTASQNILPFAETQYEIYFDRDAGLPAGMASVNITVTFQDFDPDSGVYVAKKESFLRTVAIREPPLEEQPASMMRQEWLLAGLIALVLLLLLVIIVGVSRKPRQPTPPAPTAVPAAAPPVPSAQSRQS